MYQKPFLGCAYYPEDWDESQIDYDIAKMKEAGITCARIGEFAWRKMEPKRGVYDFGWLHRVVDALRHAGIAVIMGTPTATPPIWLSKAHPEVFVLQSDGVRRNHGGRRHCCSNNPDYLEACDSIVHALGREFGKDPAIIGWQLDNEIYTGDSGCVCEYCMDSFHKRLEEQYGTVEELNRQWNLNLFSQAYEAFEDVPAAVSAWHNPHILFEWEMAHHEADREMMHRHARILRGYTDAPISTDMMPFWGLDHEKMNEPLDLVMFNHYNEPANLHEAAFWFDYLRTLKDRPFWVTETATTWNGSVSITQFLKPEGYCRVNSWLPVALGGEANMYWLWRQHWAGHELVHGSVLSPEGRPCHVFNEIQQLATEFEKSADFINGTKVVSPVALQVASHNANLIKQQSIVAGVDYSSQVIRVHKTLLTCGCCPDVIGANHNLDGYKVLISPLMMTLEIGDLAERIVRWVKDGGTWVVGPMTDIRNAIGAHYVDRAMGMLESVLGIQLDYVLPNDNTVLKTQWQDGAPLSCGKVVECYSGVDSAIASVTGGHSSLVGKTVIGKIPLGKGCVILCGTMPEEADLSRVLRIAFDNAGVATRMTSGLLAVAERAGDEREGLTVCEVANRPATLELREDMVDLLTGKVHSAGRMDIAPYGVHILEKQK